MDNNKSTGIDKNQADAAMSLKTWWALLFIYPLARPLTVFLVNRTHVSANQVTGMAIVLRLTTVACFFYGQNWALIVGAIAYIAAYVCDCTDGTVARIKCQSSELGRYLDHVSDLIGDILILLALAWSQQMLSQPFVWAMVLIHAAECYTSYLTGFALKQHTGQLGHVILLRWFNKYRNWWFKRNIKSFFSFPDYAAIIFVLFPLLGMPSVGIRIGFWFLLLVYAYTLISTFAAIHSDTKQFP